MTNRLSVGGLLVLLFGIAIAGPIACKKWEWDECRKVGHGALYCTYKMTK